MVYSRSSFTFGSVAQSCPVLWDAMDCSTPGLPVHHQLLELTHSCPPSGWCRPTISSSVVPFSHLPSFPASGSFPVSQVLISLVYVCKFLSPSWSHLTVNPLGILGCVLYVCVSISSLQICSSTLFFYILRTCSNAFVFLTSLTSMTVSRSLHVYEEGRV